MGRKRRQAAAPKKKGGLMMGIRGGVQKAARKVGVGEEKAAVAPDARRKALFWNVVTGILVIVTGVILLRRFGVIHF